MSRQAHDSMGNIEIPDGMLYDAQTQRAINNFQVSNFKIPQPMVKALILIKKHAAITTKKLNKIDEKLANSIINSCDKLLEDDYMKHFPIDLFQTGSGTSSNMNANEVIANLANISLNGESALGTNKPIHPNDHVNWGQSSNCVMPSSISVANRMEIDNLIQALQALEIAFNKKGQEFKNIVKIGRTHLQDAVPMTLGQEFSTFAIQIKHCIKRINNVLTELEELPVGGTAIGTGVASHPDFGPELCTSLSKETGINFKSALNKFEGIASRDCQVSLMGALNTLATVLIKISNDLRLLTSGPRTGLGEIIFPELQPGSSIMPGKVNPVMAEMMIQVCTHIIGKATSVTIANQNSPLQLNMMIPLIGFETLESINLLSSAINNFIEKALEGIKADEARCLEWVELSSALVTPLKNDPRVGYDKAAKLAKQCLKENKKIRNLVKESGLIPENEVDELLNVKKMVGLE